ncbi:unnamed protein product [Hydatigera taeniaeformis]|uniref:Uncharacterized protein n=1 Tax=Hydatigena taeniaeformis TaxID=6205 RepID=A0A0R3WVX1_HYDTA|nr:unnamed protein product [Hydatigera taeniaeformis]
MLALSVAIATLLCFGLFYLGFIQSHHFRRLLQKTCQPHTVSNPPKERHTALPSAMHNSPLSPYQIPSSRVQQQQGSRLAAPVPFIKEYSDQRATYFEELSKVHDSIAECEEVTTEAQTYRPIPLPRSGKPYLSPKVNIANRISKGGKEEEEEGEEGGGE